MPTDLDIEIAQNYLQDVTHLIHNNNLKKICLDVLSMKKFNMYPASRGHHHSFVGGLIIHTSQLMKIALGITIDHQSWLQCLDKDVITTSIIYHDLAKIHDYNIIKQADSTGIYQKDDVVKTTHYDLIRHINKSHALFISDYLKTTENIFIESEKTQIEKIEHCILSHHGQVKWGSVIEPKIPEAIIIHMADMISAKCSIHSPKEIIPC
jgi:3'-5' exoribonuclease